MRLRRFEAATVAQALAQVRADLGDAAVILHTRTREDAGRGVEVTAAVDEPESSAERCPRAESRAPSAERAPSREGRVPSSGTGLALPDAGPWTSDLGQRTANLAPRTSNRATGRTPDPGPWTSNPGPLPDERLDEIHRLLLELAASDAPAPVPARLRPAYRHLCQREIPAPVAKRLLASAGRRAEAGSALDALPGAAARAFRVAGHLAPGGGQRRVALVGPTGVGKTTTMAKLAGQFQRAGGGRVAFLTLDTYRIGAVAQLQIYAELLGAGLHVVRTPQEAQAAVAAEREAELLLVDTTGRSPRQREGIRAAQRLLAAIPDLEVHLVLSATTKAADLEDSLRRFRPLGYGQLLATKLDEARSPGPLLGLALDRAIPVSYLAAGQEVPDDLEPATPRRLARLLLGGGGAA
ncbi:MAG: flagellar biosynthesis protein FlhF [Candidatus Methylomirabilales bacterium]